MIAETTVRFKAPIFFEDTLHGAARMRTVGNRSYAMDFELRTGETFESGTLVAEGSAAHVFFDPVDKTRSNRAPTGSSPPSRSSKAAPKRHSPRGR